MINRRTIQHRLHHVRRIKTWQLCIILFFGVLVSATLLRLNNLEMVELRNAVATADTKGDQAAIKQSLVTLQHYVSGHMNTSLGNGVYLTASYDRARDAALAASTDTTNPNAAVYQQASIECRARFQGGVESFRNDYVTCVAERVKALSPAQDAVAGLKLPKAENYRYDFVSPFWSFDFAGVAVLFCVLVALVILARAISVISLRILLKHRFRQA